MYQQYVGRSLMTEIGRLESKRGTQIIAVMAQFIPYFLIHSYFDFEMSWELHVISAFTSIWMTLVLVGLIEIHFQVKEGRRELFEIKNRLTSND
jgi:hypothetical protein